MVGISAIGRDVTDRLRETAAVQESEARKRAILEGALDAIVTIDEAGTVLEVNPAMCATFGWTAEQMVGHNVADLVIPEECARAHRDGMAEYLRTGSSPLLGVRQDFTAQHADGHRLPVEVTIMPVDVGGRSMFTGYLRDMSARRAAEAEAERLNNRLQQTDRLDALGQLAGGIAHDFNNLLAVILNYAGLVRDDLPPGQSRRTSTRSALRHNELRISPRSCSPSAAVTHRRRPKLMPTSWSPGSARCCTARFPRPSPSSAGSHRTRGRCTATRPTSTRS